MKADESLPTLSQLLEPTNHAEIARRIGKPRGFVFRLRHGGLLRDHSVVPALAKAIHQDKDFLLRVVQNDALRAQAS